MKKNNNKKNILMLIGYLTNGGAERSIINVANALSNFHNVTLVCVSKEKQDYKCNVPIIEIPELGDRIRKPIGIFKLKKIKKKYNVDLTISYTTVFNFFNTVTRYKDATIISIRNHLSTKKEGFIYNILHKLSVKLACKVVCCSESVKLDQINNYHTKEKLVVITNFCDEENIKKTIKEESGKEKNYINDYTISTLVRLVTHKGVEHIIKAMSLVVKKVPEAKLLIMGRGPYQEELEKLVKKYNLENNIHFLGFISNPYYFITKSKCLILASDYEGFPNAIIEGMACGTPIIATDSPGGSKEILIEDADLTYYTKEKIEADYGVLIPNFINDHKKEDITDNEIILAESIIKFLENKKYQQYYHKKSLERLKTYSKEKVIKKWLDVIDEVAK